MYIPRDFGDPVQNFWNLVNDAILCDVAVERQVEITGPDAARFTQLLCPRDLSNCAIGQCKYVMLTDQDGGVINDPILLRLGENHFWLSIADSDAILWAKGVATHAAMDVQIHEPDVSPLQLQGPKSREIVRAAFGEEPADLKYYRFTKHDWEGVPLVISRTGWSSELGYEIFLCDGSAGNRLWQHLMAVGESFGLHPGHTSSIRRIEGAMLSYHADMDLSTNPLELGMDRLIDLDSPVDFIGKSALLRARDQGPTRLSVGLELDGAPLEASNTVRWPVSQDGSQIGYVSSAIHSPRLNKNIALALVARDFTGLGQKATIETEFGTRLATVVPKPFFDPKKSIAME
jgi:aminomethyltransferase